MELSFFDNSGSNLYENAGLNANQHIQKAIEEFRQLSPEERAEKPLLYYLLGSGTPPYKMSKKDSNYIGKTIKGMNCGNCRFTFMRYVNKQYICSQIEGDVKLNHWCRLWVSGNTTKR